jgi:uncharacterized protein (DUF885 family)
MSWSKPPVVLPLVLALTLALGLGACKPTGPGKEGVAGESGQLAPANSPWQQSVDAFMTGWFERNPAQAAFNGKHEFDGQLPDWSPEGLKSNIAWLHEQRDKLAGFKDDQLDSVQRFQREYALAVIDGQLFWLEESGFPNSNPAFYAGDLSPSMYLTRPYAPLDKRMAAFIKYQQALPKAIEQIKGNLREQLPTSYIELGVNTFGGYASFFKDDVPKIFAEVKDPGLQQQLAASNAAAIAATQGLADWLKAKKPQATEDFALGAERFSRMLHATERVDLPIAELKAAGEADLARNLDALTAACKDFDPGESLAACVKMAQEDKPQGSPVEAAKAQLTDLRNFVQQHDLVSIPGNEQATVAEAPPYNRWNFAYIEIPGPYETNLPSVYYISPPDPTWSPQVQADYLPDRATLTFVSAHEVWPGHFLQFLHSNRADWRFGQVFVGYAFAEGWAHYAEEMMWDAGLGDNLPAMHIGKLSNALLRDARYLSAIGLHTGGMTVAESVALFRDKALQPEGTARQQAARGTFDPAYLNYTLGKLMIMRLRDDWLASHGGKGELRGFHDQFLSYGGPPIPLVRAQMLGGPAEAKLWSPPSTDAAAAPTASDMAPAAPASTN